jgi:hypothetical protein
MLDDIVISISHYLDVPSIVSVMRRMNKHWSELSYNADVWTFSSYEFLLGGHVYADEPVYDIAERMSRLRSIRSKFFEHLAAMKVYIPDSRLSSQYGKTLSHLLQQCKSLQSLHIELGELKLSRIVVEACIEAAASSTSPLSSLREFIVNREGGNEQI